MQKLKEIEFKDKVRNFQPPVSGQEIMETFDLQPCAIVGTIKMTIKEAILDGKISNEHEPARKLMLELGKKFGLEIKSTQN